MLARRPAFTILAFAAWALIAAACKGGDDDGATVDAADDAPDVAIDAAVDATVDAPAEAPLEDDLGHVDPIDELTRVGDRALSVDSYGHWVLWNLATRTQVARGESVCGTCAVPRAELRGNLVSIRLPTGLELRNATTGAITAMVPTSVLRVGTASDGSYVWAANATGLHLWRPDGSELLTVAGNYNTGILRGAPTEVRIAAGPAGPMTIETIRIADGARSTIPFNGTFSSWFVDGSKFLTFTGTIVRVYRLDGTLAGLGTVNTLENLTGQGDYVWTFPNGTSSNRPLTIYPVASIGIPAQTYDLQIAHVVVAGGSTIGILDHSARSISIVSLGAAITRTAAIPVGGSTVRLYAADAGGWVIGDFGGVVRTGVDATLGGPLDRGRLTAVAGSQAGVAALANSAGAIELVRTGAAPVVTRTIPQRTTHVELSTDGAVLVTAADATYGDDRTLRVLDVTSGAVTHAWPYTRLDDPAFVDFSFARTGLVLAHYLVHSDAGQPTYVRRLTRSDGTMLPDYGPAPAEIFPRGFQGSHLFSPSGERAVISPPTQYLLEATTQFFQQGQLVEAVNGLGIGWIDEDHVLVAKYRYGGNSSSDVFVSSTIYNADATVAMASPMPDTRAANGGSVRPVIAAAGRGQVYARAKNVVYDATTGAVVWQGPANSTGGAVAGDFVVYTIGTRLVVERFRP